MGRSPVRRLAVRSLSAAAVIVAALGIAAFLIGPGRERTGRGNDADVAALAAMTGVEPAAVVVTDDGAVLTRWRDGVVELLFARKAQDGWRVATIDRTPAPRPEGGAGGAIETVTCANAGLSSPTFVFGQLVGQRESTLQLRGLAASGGILSDETYVFAVEAGPQPGARFWVMGKRLGAPPSPWPVDGVGPPPTGAYFGGSLRQPRHCTLP